MIKFSVSVFFSVGFALLAFGAIYWPEFAGTFSASPGVGLITIALIIFFWSKKNRPLMLYKSLKLYYLLWIPILGSIVSFGIFGWNPLFASKFFTLGLLSVIWLAPLMLIDEICIKQIYYASICGFVICLIGYLLSDLNPNLMPEQIHRIVFGGIFADYSDLRPRGFSEEPSQFSTTLSRYLLIIFLIRESIRPYSAWRLVSFLVILAVILGMLGSKGAILSLAIAFISCGLSWGLMPLLVLIIPLGWFYIQPQIESLGADMDLYTSVATRVGLAFAGIVAIAVNPIGYGSYGFYGVVQSFGRWIIDSFIVNTSLNSIEITQIVENLINVSIKTTLLDFGIVFGWAFIFLMFRITGLINMKDLRARTAYIFLLLTALSTSGHLSITFFMGMAILLRLYPSKKSPIQFNNIH